MKTEIPILLGQLRDIAQMMPGGGDTDPLVDALASIANDAADAIEALLAGQDEARAVVRDTLWMAGRYADSRRTYAVSQYNDARVKAEQGGYSGDAKPAVDGDEPDHATLVERVAAAEGARKRFRDLLMSRPANNADLPGSYVAWNSRMYLVDADGFLHEPEELATAMRRASK